MDPIHEITNVLKEKPFIRNNYDNVGHEGICLNLEVDYIVIKFLHIVQCRFKLS